MSKLGREGLSDEYNSLLPTNNNEEISAADEREVAENFNDSKFNLTDDDTKEIIHNKSSSNISLYNRIRSFELGYKLFYYDIVSQETNGGDTIVFSDELGTNWSQASHQDAQVASSPTVIISYPAIASYFGIPLSEIKVTGYWEASAGGYNGVIETNEFNPLSESGTYINNTSARLYTFRNDTQTVPSEYNIRYVFSYEPTEYWEVENI